MNKIVLAAAATLLLAGTASAADMAARPYTKAPAPVVVPVYNWTGFYVGGNVGGMWTDQNAFWLNSVQPIVNFNHNQSTGIGGAHAGAQYQWNNIVFGIEAAWFTGFNSGQVIGSPPTGCPAVTFTCQAGVSNVWTVGPRLGYAVNDWLLYGTGGYANGQISTRSFRTATGVVFDDFSNRQGGWFAGAGVEWAAWKSGSTALVLGAEYQHIDLGTARMVSPGDGGVCLVDCRDINTKIDLVRARLSVKFGAPAAVVAKY
jgi:outer membrane immunogenic protein